MGVERILNSHARNKVLSGLLCNDIYGDLDGISKNLEVPIKLVEYIRDITYGLCWSSGLRSKTTYDTFVKSENAICCTQTNYNILENVLINMDGLAKGGRVKPRYNIFTTSIGNNNTGDILSYERGVVQKLTTGKCEHKQMGLSTIKIMVVYEVDKNENVRNGNISVTLAINIAKDRNNEPTKLYGSVGVTVYGAENIDRLIGGKLNKLLETGNKNIAKLFEMEKEQYDKFKTTDGMEVYIYHGDCKYY